MKNEKIVMVVPKINQPEDQDLNNVTVIIIINRIIINIYIPIHQAPNHLGSLLSIIGVKEGSMYEFKHKKPKMKPPAGPALLNAIVIPI